MKQTSIEWFNDEIIIHLNFDQRLYLKDIFKQAKEMEKEQIILSHINGQSEYDSQAFSSTNKKIAEQYYNETFKNK